MHEPLILHERQQELVNLCLDHKYTLAYGSSRGGKTFAFFYMMVVRALTFPGSTHCVIRSTAASIPSTVWPTALDVLKRLAPGFREETDENKNERRITLPTGDGQPPSTIWFFGAQNDEAVDKLMGGEFATILIDEIVDFSHKIFTKVRTRLNTNLRNDLGRLDLKFFATCNPRAKSHWVHDQWLKKVKPGTATPLKQAASYGALQFDRDSNPDVDADYYADMEDDSAEERSSYMLGEWYDEVEGAIFPDASLDNHREAAPGDYDLTVIAVDPAVTANKESDETGIIVAGARGEGSDRHYYPLADLSGRYHTHDFLMIAINAYHEYGCAKLVIETNQGGDVWEAMIRDLDPRVNTRTVRAAGGQGKNERAKPIGAIMKAGHIHHPLIGSKEAEQFAPLEKQLLSMTGDLDRRSKGKSPDRADAYVYAISEMLTGHIAKPVVQSKLGGWFA